MLEFLSHNLYLALLLPLWIFLIIMVGRFFSVYVNKIVIRSLTLFSSAFGALISGLLLWKLPVDKILETQIPFIKINNFIINCGIHIDRLALIFTLVLFLVSFLVQLFTIQYMKNEKKTYRFYALLNIFNFTMASMFFSPNLFQTYFFWEIAGIISYLLIGFEYFKKEKSIASKKVFLINRIGDTSLIGAILLSAYFIYSYSNNIHLTSLSFTDMNIISTLLYAYATEPMFQIICVMFIIGAFAKSAQFPFYTWLQDAMEAKLPISALLHSSTLVASGVFLIIRILPFLTLEEYLTKFIAVCGLLTALICSISACAQINPKKALAYSTSAQFGLIYFAIGILNIKAALAFFIAHAFIKSMLFLTLPNKNECWNYIKFILFLIAGLSLSGLLFSGMLTKEMMLVGLGPKGVLILSVLAFLTAFYIIRIALVIYDNNGIEKKSLPKIELIAPTGLLVLNIIFYFFLRKQVEYSIAEPFWAAITAWILVYLLYVKDLFKKIPVIYPLAYNGFYLDNFYTKIVSGFYEQICKISNFIDLKIFTNYTPLITTTKLGIKTASVIENSIFNKSINIIENSFKYFSQKYKEAQCGNIQKYNAYAFIIITVILTFLILAYTAIIDYIGG